MNYLNYFRQFTINEPAGTGNWPDPTIAIIGTPGTFWEIPGQIGHSEDVQRQVGRIPDGENGNSNLDNLDSPNGQTPLMKS